jgi:purine-binding chemotaxis protein CheW
MASVDKTLDILNLQFTGGENETQLLIFSVDGEEFGIDVLLVQEIIRYIPPTKIPNAPRAVHGVINFRGEVIPVLDIRERFNLSEKAYDEFTVIVIVECDGKTMGLVVDKVSDIVNLPNKNTQALPEISFDEKTAYLKGMGKLGERLILLLDSDKLMDLKEKSQLNAMVDSVQEESSPDAAIG